jgi:hypothetical protein
VKSKYLSKFESVLSKVVSISPYDVILAYSGGKDSSYTLGILRKNYDLRVLAVTFNHGFHSPQAMENMRVITQALDVDHMRFSPSPKTVRHAFRESVAARPYSLRTLQRASTICTTCMHLVKSLVLKTAIEMEIPLVAYGWSPGQIPIRSSVMRLNGRMVRQTQNAMAAVLTPIMGRELRPYILTEDHLKRIDASEAESAEAGLYYTYPLAFLEYDENKMVQELTRMGWRAPSDTDVNSTNCLLNAFAVQDQLDHFGFHPYALTVAGLVREGLMSRETGLSRLAQPPDQCTVEFVRNVLGI